MVEIKPLKTTRRVLTWLSVYPADENTHKWEKLAYISCTSFVCIVNVCFFLATVAYLKKFILTDLEESLYAMYQCVGTLPLLIAILVQFTLRQKTIVIFKKLTNIYTEHANEESFDFLAKVNEKSEWIWKMYFYVMAGYFCNIALSSASSVFFQNEPDHLYHSCRIILPWNQTTLLGYFGETCFNLLFVVCYLIFNGAIMLLFFFIALHQRAFYEMFRHALRKLDQSKDDRKELLNDLIRFHITAKDLFWESAEFYSLIILSQLFCSSFYMACLVFHLNLQMKQQNFTTAAFLLLELMAGTLNFFGFCYFGQKTARSFEKMGECLYYECDWPDYPIELKKHFILIIRNAQLPMYYRGYDLVILNMETALRIIGTIYKCYMVFKTLTSDDFME